MTSRLPVSPRLILFLLLGLISFQGMAQPGNASSAREQAELHFDLTGYWVPIISEDWRNRMVTPAIGDIGFYERMPLTDEGVRVAMAWNPSADLANGLACKAFGVGNIMRMPGRLNISWEDDNTLRIDTAAGEQSRFLRFAPDVADRQQDAGSWQGHSVASWFKQRQGEGFGPGRNVGPGTLRVVSTDMQAGYLRRNGVPYSELATVTEYFTRHDDFGSEWFTVTTVVEDPVYLEEPFVTSTHFRKEANGRNWNPAPCEIVAPMQYEVSEVSPF